MLLMGKRTVTKLVLVFSLLTNVAAQLIVRRFEFQRIGGD